MGKFQTELLDFFMKDFSSRDHTGNYEFIQIKINNTIY